MQKQIKRIAAILALFATILPSLSTAANGPGGVTPPNGSETLINPSEIPLVRKTPSWFKKPKKDTPAEQLTYAKALETEARNRAASKAYRNLVHEWHDSKQAVIAQQSYARMLEKRGKYDKAFDEYQYLVHFFAGQFKYNNILQKQYAIANATREENDEKEAIHMYKRIVKNAPRWKKTPLCQLLVGILYEETGDHDEAVLAYELLITRYPNSPQTADASFRYAKCLTGISRHYPRDERSCKRALSALAAFRKQYPEHPGNQEAQTLWTERKEHLANLYFQRATFYDKRGKKEAAIIAYTDFITKFSGTEKFDRAKARLADLEAQVKGPRNQPGKSR